MHISLGRKKHHIDSVDRFEDALTSMFFGTLRYLHPNLIAHFFCSLIESEISAESVIIEFWPRNETAKSYVEPDLIVIFKKSGRVTAKLLIECKWDSPQSSNGQLLTQWESVPTDERSYTSHLYIVKRKSYGIIDVNKNLESGAQCLDSAQFLLWSSRIKVISWMDILNASNGIPKKNVDIIDGHVLDLWKSDIAAMFNRIGVRAFCGFDALQSSLCDPIKNPIFWHGQRRERFCVEAVPLVTERFIFWQS